MRKRGITVGIFLGIMIMLTPVFGFQSPDKGATQTLVGIADRERGRAQHFVSSDGDCGTAEPCYSKIQDAIDAAPDGSEILVRQGTYEESISLTSGKTVLVKGGYDSAYSQQTANTTFIQGLGQTTIQATGGSLKFQMLSIFPSGCCILTINTTGQGSGQVHVSPSGTAFQPGTVVTLTAEENPGSKFTAWGGACSGTQLTCQLTMNEHKDVSANFSAASDTWTDPITGMVFVWVAGGCYEMGCGDWTDSCDSNELPVHEVCVDGFWMGKYEVTQRQWKQIMGSNPSWFKSGDNYPVEYVSWNDCQGFISDLNSQSGKTFRFPTEAEWEYAARSGGREEKYAGGNDPDSLGWYWDNSGRHTHEAGTKAANGLGIYDMTGNVWEWCSDWYSSGYYTHSPRNNPQGPYSGLDRVIRGGGWYDSAQDCRAAFRYNGWPVGRRDLIGFRLVFSSGQQ